MVGLQRQEAQQRNARVEDRSGVEADAEERWGKEAKLSFAGHVLTENRNGLVKDLRVTEANGLCEREAALAMIDAHVDRGATIGADSAYNTKDFVEDCRERGVTPHVAGKKRSAIDGTDQPPRWLPGEPEGTEAH